MSTHSDRSLFVPLGRPRVMGVLNVTPDSFSDGGLHLAPEAAIAHGQRLLADGADLIDIGGESTRPGATRPLVTEELARVVPVVEALAAAGAVVSVDTMRAEVAAGAVAAGAGVVNDVSGGLADPEMLGFVAEAGVTYVAMHWRGHADRMAGLTTYAGGVVAGVCEELAERVEAILAAGVDAERLVLDPGLGFAKTADQSWEVLADLDPVLALGQPVLVGASRKSFLGALLRAPGASEDPAGPPRSVEGRGHADTAVTVHLAQRGVWGVRVHDVRAARDALAVVTRLCEGAP